MRTTITIEDETFRKLKKIGHQTGQSFKAVVNQALRMGIEKDRIAITARPYRVRPVSMGAVVGSYNLVKALDVADQLENEEIARELRLRK